MELAAAAYPSFSETEVSRLALEHLKTYLICDVEESQ
jgi:hypothetical protein